jgi:transketolase
VKKTAPKKMALSRETLGILTDSEVKEVLGGAYSDRCTTSRDVCCP